ncbi:MAG: malectin domain-containing carbohydrate-binding protein, partial [candidate division KSB1 bacterium]|nr:malectin domain-containing carbohydrate-binding protein [candidate division KSB1 bacterium]
MGYFTKIVTRLALVLGFLVVLRSPVQSQTGGAGYALDFDGVNDYVEVPDNALLSGGVGKSITVEAWIYPHKVDKTTTIMMKDLNAEWKDWGIGVLNDGELFATIENDGDDWGYEAGSISANVWTHVAFTFDNPSNKVRLFINGVEAGTGKTFTKDMPDTGAPIRIGMRYTSAYPFPFDGLIDEVRIWNFARTAAEIQATMYKTLTGTETGLIGYWRFDEGSGQVANDGTSNGNHGQLGSTSTGDVNDPAWVVSDAPIPPLTLVRVNAGGPAYTDTQGKLWSADQPYTSGSWGYVGGAVAATTDPIANTTDDPLYQKYRYSETSFSYQFDVPNGFYEVTLLFVEPYWTSANKRVFDVSIEGTVVLNDWDIYAQVGHDYATTRSFTVRVSDGQLNINFTPVKSFPLVSAIGISLVPDFQVRVNAGGPTYTDVAGKVWYADQPYSPNGWGYVGGAISATT